MRYFLDTEFYEDGKTTEPRVSFGCLMAMTYIRPATLFDDNAAEGMGDDEEKKP